MHLLVIGLKTKPDGHGPGEGVGPASAMPPPSQVLRLRAKATAGEIVGTNAMVIAPLVAEVVANCAPFAPTSRYAGQVFIATAAAATLTVNATAGS